MKRALLMAALALTGCGTSDDLAYVKGCRQLGGIPVVSYLPVDSSAMFPKSVACIKREALLSPAEVASLQGGRP